MPPPVNSWNEWDPLEEVIVGVVDGAVFPSWTRINAVTVPDDEWEPAIQAMCGKPGNAFHPHVVAAAQKALDRLVRLLESEGVTVRRPEHVDYTRGFSTPDWSVDSGFCAANPRDVFLVVGNEIIEAPMADRSRQHESRAYHTLMLEYFKRGARWSAAPKPHLTDAQYKNNYVRPREGDSYMSYIINEFEPTFDAAEVARCGRDLFIQRSHTCNTLGIHWLRSHLGDGFKVHVLESRDPHAIHLDSTFVPLAAGKALLNSAYLDMSRLPRILEKWQIFHAPPGVPTPLSTRGLLSGWIHLNVLSLDGHRIIVEKRQEPLIDALRRWGFEPIPCDFEDFYPFVGSFHCATLDVRRRGTLQSYF